MTRAGTAKQELFWVGNSRECLKKFPKRARETFGIALNVIQDGSTPTISTPKPGYGPGVCELADDVRSNTYRVAYIAKLESGIYVLHAYNKKATSGNKTPQVIIKLIKERLAEAMKKDKQKSGVK